MGATRIMRSTAAVVALTTASCSGQPGSDVAAETAVAPEVPPESAPVVPFPAPDPHAYRYVGPCPPPSPAEDRGKAPDKEHFWSPGYFRWTGREHVWVPGAWHPRREGLAYVAPHWEEWRRRWHFVPGYWR